MRKQTLMTTALASALTVGLASHAAVQAAETPAANDTVEIIVTANKRQQSVQKVGAAITALSGNDLAQQDRQRIDDVLASVPGVKVQTISNGFAVAMRGVGVEAQPGLGDPAVAMNLDGVYTDRPEAGRTAFFDIGRVEVLRGPQGTLYGRNSTAGVVNVISNDPVGSTQGAISVGAGNFSKFEANLMGNVALTDKLWFRAAAYGLKHDGYLSNGQQDANDVGARVKLLYNASEQLKLLVGSDYGKISGNGVGGTDPFTEGHGYSYWNTSNPTPNSLTSESLKIYARADLNLGWATLTAIPAWQKLTNDFASNLGPFFIIYNEQEQQNSLELRLAGNNPNRVQWTAGAFYYDNDLPVVTTSPISQTQISRAKSLAAFTDVTVTVAEGWRLNAGVRETEDKKNISISQVVGGVASASAFDKTFSRFDYKLAVEHDLSATSMLYGKISTGFRSGGLYGTGATDSFRPEIITSYEAGSKNRLFGRRLTVNLSAFYYDYQDYQATNVIFVGGAPVTAVFNAPGAKTYGAELETSYALDNADRIEFTAAYLHARFDDGFVLNGVDYSGQVLGHAPEWHLTAAYEHRFDLGNAGSLLARADTAYETTSYATFVQNEYSRQHPYVLSNAQVTWTPQTGNWALTAYVKNIENVAVKAQYLSQGPSIVLLQPRTYGAKISYTF